jgi:hypothetical protein
MKELDSESEIHQGWYFSGSAGIQGPLSESELIQKVLSNEMNEEGLVWTSSFNEWQKFSQVRELAARLQTEQKNKAETLAVELLRKKEPIDTQQWVHSDEFWSKISQKNSVIFKELSSLNFVPSPSGHEVPSNRHLKESQRKVQMSLVVGCIVSGIIAVFIFKMIPEKVHPRPELTYAQELQHRQILSEPYSKAGALGMVFYNNGFFVSSNVPDGSLLEVVLQGIPETLIGKFKNDLSSSLQIRGGFAKFPNLDGIVEGDYRIKLICQSCQNRFSPLYETTISLRRGSPSDYDQALAIYHRDLRKKARQEIQEMREILQTLQAKLSQSGPSGRTDFVNLGHQLKVEVDRIFEGGRQGEYFYIEILTKVKRVTDSANSIQTASPSEQFWGRKSILTEIEKILANISEVESLPLTANGMPRKSRVNW